MAPIGEKMKQMGHNIKDALTPGSHDDTTRNTTTTYTPESGGDYYTKTGNATTDPTDATGGDGEYGTRAAGADTYAAGSGTGVYTGKDVASYGTTGMTQDSGDDVAARGLGTAPMEDATREGKGAVLGQDYYTGTEDRTRVRERVEQIREHRPVEKEYVVETRATGRERERGDQRREEHLGARERLVGEDEGTFDQRDRDAGAAKYAGGDSNVASDF